MEGRDLIRSAAAALRETADQIGTLLDRARAGTVRRRLELLAAMLSGHARDLESYLDPTNGKPYLVGGAIDAFRRAYDLTAAEAQVALRIAAGDSVADIAAAGHLSPQTVRNQLKLVFQKTATKRQADLVRLVLTGISAERPMRGVHAAQNQGRSANGGKQRRPEK